MTSQAIEGTGMTLRMSGGWTSDIVEMQLPYVVRQAIDDTHLGDTIVRWIPSKDIEYGTMAIRFWHDPDNILPITGQPETMVITYPDGVNHLAVIGYVEKIGKESIKVGELMQTDAMVRILHYPKMPSAANGSFPMWIGALTGKVVTDIMETATLRYLSDDTPGGVDSTVDAVICTSAYKDKSLCNMDLASSNKAKIRNNVFGRRAIDLFNGTTYNSLYIASGVGDLLFSKNSAMAVVASVPNNYNSLYADIIGLYFTNASARIQIQPRKTYCTLSYAFDLGPSLTYNIPANGNPTSFVFVGKRDGGSVKMYVNNIFSQSTGPDGGEGHCTGAAFGQFYGVWPGLTKLRDFAYWNVSMSDTDFESLNDQLCAEYGIT